MLNIRRIKPIGSQVLVTEEIYGYDDVNPAGIIVHRKGDLKYHQQVIAVGDDVRFVKPGDIVEINFYKYAETRYEKGSLKELEDTTVVKLRLNEVDLVDENNELVPCFIIDERDVRYILEDFDEVTYNNKDEEELISGHRKQLILPSNRILL